MLEVYGDITNFTDGVLLNGVNCQRRMGSGVAKAYYTKWPEVKNQYLKTEPKLGKMYTVKINEQLFVANCYTQDRYGNDGRQYADYDAVRLSVVEAAIFAARSSLDVKTPLIGTGLGGLDPEKIKEILRNIETLVGVEFTLCLLPS